MRHNKPIIAHPVLFFPLLCTPKSLVFRMKNTSERHFIYRTDDPSNFAWIAYINIVMNWSLVMPAFHSDTFLLGIIFNLSYLITAALARRVVGTKQCKCLILHIFFGSSSVRHHGDLESLNGELPHIDATAFFRRLSALHRRTHRDFREQRGMT